MPDPNTGYCHLCDAPLTPGRLDAILDHVRVIHPDQWGDGPERWPDDGLVYDDTTRERLRSFIGYATARLADHMRHTEPLPDGTPDYSTFSTRYAEPPPPAWARKLNRARKRLDAPWADQ